MSDLQISTLETQLDTKKTIKQSHKKILPPKKIAENISFQKLKHYH